jgi:hypothetical protein
MSSRAGFMLPLYAIDYFHRKGWKKLPPQAPGAREGCARAPVLVLQCDLLGSRHHSGEEPRPVTLYLERFAVRTASREGP